MGFELEANCGLTEPIIEAESLIKDMVEQEILAGERVEQDAPSHEVHVTPNEIMETNEVVIPSQDGVIKRKGGRPTKAQQELNQALRSEKLAKQLADNPPTRSSSRLKNKSPEEEG